MADNVQTNSGSGGPTFATDAIGSAPEIQWPFVKLAWGPRDTANEVDKAAGKSIPMQGEAAHDAATTGNPVLMGGEARTTSGTAVQDGDAVRMRCDTLGKQVVLQGATHDQQVNGTANFTNTTAADVIAAAGVGARIAVTSVLVTNASATGTKVSIRDGATAKVTGYAAPSGGGFQLNAGGRPLFIGTANTAIQAVCGTTAADVDVSISGYVITN